MKFIIETYGRFLLSGTAFLLVLILAVCGIEDTKGNKGIFKILGANLSIMNTDYAACTDFVCYQDESRKGMPTIKYEYTEKIYANEEILVADFMKACDANGNSLKLRILKVTDAAGNDMISYFDKDSGTIHFPTEGSYQIKAAVIDSSYKKYTCAIKIPVNKGKGG